MRERLGIARRFDLALASVLTIVARLGKNVISFLHFRRWTRRPGHGSRIGTHTVKCLRENWRFRGYGGFIDGSLHEVLILMSGYGTRACECEPVLPPNALLPPANVAHHDPEASRRSHS